MKILRILAKNQQVYLMVTTVTVILALLTSLLFPLEYSSSSRVLIVNPSDVSTDVYSNIKSIERTTEKLSHIINTTSFYDKVLNSGFDIDEDYFKTVEKKRRKQWDKMINAQVLRGAGMLEVTVYHENKVQAENLSKAITQVMSTAAWEYVGSRNIQVKEVDTPLVSTWPVRPNFLLNGLLSAILGVILSTIYVLAGQKKFVLDILNLEESDIGAHDIHGYAPQDDSIKDTYSKEDVDAFFAEADEIEYEKPAGKQAGKDYHYFQNM